MKYKDILRQWNELVPKVQQLQANIEKCIEDEEYESEIEKDDLRSMQRGCYEIFRILMGYFD